MMVSFRRLGIVALAVTLSSARAWGGSLESDIRAVLSDKALGKASVGVAVARVGTAAGPDFLFQSNATTPLMPASNLKVVTTSAALATLGPDFKFRTELLLKDGDLYLIGDGDPTVGDPDPAIGLATDQLFKFWAQQLKQKGITSIRHVYVDDSIFDREFAHPSWPEDQLNLRYVAEVSGFSFRRNTIEIEARQSKTGVELALNPATAYVKLSNAVKAGGRNAIGAVRTPGTNEIVVRGEVPKGSTGNFEVTIHDPALYGATILFETLRSEGIQMTGGVGRNTSARTVRNAQPGLFTQIGALETPLAIVLKRCNKDSQNLYAESMAKRLAAKATGQPGSWAGSRATIGTWLNKLGVPSDQFSLDDGCGLSRNNRISAEGMVKVLASDFAAPYRDTFVGSMAVGGMDGTLENRFNGDLAGRVHAKTGFINGVSTLSGFLKGKNNQWYAFSILMNNVSGAKPLHDRIVKAIDENAR